MAVLTQWAFCSEETKTLTARATNLERMLRALEATALKADEFFEDNDRLTKALDGLREHTVTLELGGELRHLSDLALRSRKLARLSVWHQARVRSGRASVQLAVYSATRRAAKEYDHGCAHAPSDVWMWPYSVKVAEARARVDRACAGIKRLSVVQSQVQAFQTARAQLEDLFQAIKTVRSSRGEFQVIQEPPPREDDHGSVVFPQKET